MKRMQMKETPNELISIEELKLFLESKKVLSQISEMDIYHLSIGKETTLIKNIEYQGQIFDARLYLQEDENGKLLLHIEKKHKKLEIPDKICNIKIEPAQKEELLKGKILGPYGKEGSEFYILFDKDLNKVTYRSESKMGVPYQFGGYTFSAQERSKLANGEEIGPKVYNVNGEKILANYRVELTSGLSSQEITIHKNNLSTKDAKEFTEKYNIHSDNIVHIPTLSGFDKTYESHIGQKVLLGDYSNPVSFLGDSVKYLPQGNNLPVVYSINKTFKFHTIVFDQRTEIPKRFFNIELNDRQIEILKKESSLKNLEITTHAGQKLNCDLVFYNKDGYNFLIFQANEKALQKAMASISTTQIKDHLIKLSNLTLNDKLILDLIDNRAFNHVAAILKNGLPVSKNLMHELQNSMLLSTLDKKLLAGILNNQEENHNANSKDESKDIDIKKKNSKDYDLPKNEQKRRGRGEELLDKASRPVKSLFHDM